VQNRDATQRRRSVTAIELFGGGGQSRSGSISSQPPQRRGSITAAELFGRVTTDKPSTSLPADSHAATAAAASAAHEKETRTVKGETRDGCRDTQSQPTSSSRLHSSQTSCSNATPTRPSTERLATWGVPGNTLEPPRSSEHVSTSPAGFTIIYEDRGDQETGNVSLDNDIDDNASQMSSCAAWEAVRREHEEAMHSAAVPVAGTMSSHSEDGIGTPRMQTDIVGDSQIRPGTGFRFDGYAGQPTSPEPAIRVGSASQRSPRTTHFQRMLANSPGFRLG
jgi:hypothetical protein